MKTYIRILKYLKNYKKQLALSMILSIIFSIFSALSVYLTIPLLKTLFFPSTGDITPPSHSGISGIYNNLQYYFERFIFNFHKNEKL